MGKRWEKRDQMIKNITNTTVLKSSKSIFYSTVIDDRGRAEESLSEQEGTLRLRDIHPNHIP